MEKDSESKESIVISVSRLGSVLTTKAKRIGFP